MREETNERCVVGSDGFFSEYVATCEDGKTGERRPLFYELKEGERLIEAPPPYWVLGTKERARWTGSGWDAPEPQPAELRKRLYAEMLFEYPDGTQKTVDEANGIWLHYAAEGRDMSETEAWIRGKKGAIRKMHPDKL